MNRLVVAFIVLLMMGCKRDQATTVVAPSQDSSPDESQLNIEPRPSMVSQPNLESQPTIEPQAVPSDEFKQPEIGLVAAPSGIKIPKMEDWVQIDSFRFEGANLSGVASVHDQIVMVSDTARRVIMKVDLKSRLAEDICLDMQVPYLNLRNFRLIIPQYDKDSVFVFRGDPPMFKFHFPYKLDKPTSMDAFRIDDFIIVDRGNNRLLINKHGKYSLVGSLGNGAEQFKDPSYVQVVGNSIYVTDTGNKRIQLLTAEASFIKSFGEDKLSKPGAMATDGVFLFVCDEGLDEIFVYNQEGQLLYRIKDKISDPRDIFFLNGRLLVTDEQGLLRIYENKMYKAS